MLVRRQVFERIGTLDEQYFFSFEDVDFCLNARRVGFSTVLAADALVRHEGGLSIGPRSARKLYFSTRNHLRAAARTGDERFPGHAAVRAAWIVALGLAYALRPGGAPRLAGMRSVLLGTWHHVRGRYEDGP
jgi:GT2 family glycosyltransferase